MKKILLFAGAMLALTAVVANAQINLAYTDCGAAGTQAKTSTCNSNTGSTNIYGSYMSPSGTVGITGAEGVVDLQTNQTTLSPWWSFGTGFCRPTSLKCNFNQACASASDYWGTIPGGPFGGFGYFPGFGGANRGRIKVVVAIDGTAATALDGVSEYYAFNLIIDNAKTVGTGNCAGCTDGVCIVFNSLKLTQGAGIGDYLLVSPANSNFVTWNGGAVGVGPYGGQGCPGATPTHSSSWGQVKALYR